MVSRLLMGSSLLTGNNTVPGAAMPEELKVLLPDIFKAVRDYGCDFYPSVIEILRDDEISEIVAYIGFPVRYPHWRFGMEYEELQSQYELGVSKVSELVINTNPSYIYCLSSNTLVDNVTVIAHALGHSDFLKNNINFLKTNTEMMSKMANNGLRIRKYMERWGKERVTEFIDHVLRLETLIDPSSAWKKREIKKPIIKDERKYFYARRLHVDQDRDYMEEWINTEEWAKHEDERIKELEIADQLQLFVNPTRDILGFLKDFAPLKPWQSDIIAMLYEEALYFYPQMKTKTLNEGWASFVDYKIMAVQGLASLGQESHDCGIVEYAKHKMNVFGGKYSLNPYKLGFYLLLDIEDRWNKGKFGDDWENCKDLHELEKWDKKLGLGKEKVFEVREYYDDFAFINEFFTEDFCNEHEFFEWSKTATGEYIIESRDYKKIKEKLLRKFLNCGRPDIRLVDPNFMGRGYFLLEHYWDGRELLESYAKAVLTSLRCLWNDTVFLATRNKDGEEIVMTCDSNKEEEVEVLPREEFEKNWF